MAWVGCAIGIADLAFGLLAGMEAGLSQRELQRALGGT